MVETTYKIKNTLSKKTNKQNSWIEIVLATIIQNVSCTEEKLEDFRSTFDFIAIDLKYKIFVLTELLN